MKRIPYVLLVVLAALVLIGCAERNVINQDFKLSRVNNTVYVLHPNTVVHEIIVNNELVPWENNENLINKDGPSEACIFTKSLIYKKINLTVGAIILYKDAILPLPIGIDEVSRGKYDFSDVNIPYTVTRKADSLRVNFFLMLEKRFVLVVTYGEQSLDPEGSYNPQDLPPLEFPLSKDFIDRLVSRGKATFRADPQDLRNYWQPATPKT